jgi:hypothetical protein
MSSTCNCAKQQQQQQKQQQRQEKQQQQKQKQQKQQFRRALEFTSTASPRQSLNAEQ